MCLSLYTDANPIIPRSFLTNLVNKFKHTAGFAHPRQQQNHHTRNHHIYGSPLQGLCFPKDQLISKAIYGLLTSPKKWTDKFVLFAFLLFTANKSNSSVCFLGESTARQSAFWFYLTFNKAGICFGECCRFNTVIAVYF